MEIENPNKNFHPNEWLQQLLAISHDYYVLQGIEVIIIGFLLYKLLGVIPRSRGYGVMIVFFLLLFMNELAQALNLFILQEVFGTISYGVLFLMIVFQNEFRRAFLGIRRVNEKRPFTSREKMSSPPQVISSVTHALKLFSEKKIGALIAIQNKDSLAEIGYSGQKIACIVTPEMIVTIFSPGSPLHDGAMMITGHTIDRVGVKLPVLDRDDVDPQVGLRHRAAMGLSEETDALVFVSSEENGNLSFFLNGAWTSCRSPEQLERILQQAAP